MTGRGGVLLNLNLLDVFLWGSAMSKMYHGGKSEQDRRCTCDIILRRLGVTIFAVEKQ